MQSLLARVKHTHILSYNVKMMPFDSTDEERADKIIKHLKEYDILCLQELFSSSIRAKIEDAASRDCGLTQRNEGPPRDLFSGHVVGSGLAILTRYRVVKQSYSAFSTADEVGFDSLASKGVAHSLLEVRKDSFLHVFVAHTQSGYGKPQRRARFAQCRHIAEFVRQCTDDDEYEALLVGDFNVDAHIEIDYNSLLSIVNNELLPKQYAFDIGAQERAKRATYAETNENIDYALAIVRRGKVAHSYRSVVRQWTYSDHYALEIIRRE